MRSSIVRTPPDVACLSPADRRSSLRSSQRYQVSLRTEDSGARPAFTRGTLMDVSLGGALIAVEDYFRRGTRCSLEICGALGRVIPNTAVGRVVGTSVGPRGDFLLRIGFSEPLKAIKEPGKL